jgi:hypothetical protein
LSEIQWHILIDTLAASVITISFFFTDHLTGMRVVLLLFAATDIIMILNRQKVRKSLFFVISAVFLAFLVIMGLLEAFTLYMLIFGIVLVIGSYRTLFEEKGEI